MPWLIFAAATPSKPDIPYLSVCLFKNITQLPCAFCGLTRSLALIWQGQWAETVNYHLLGIPVFLMLALMAILGPLFPDTAQRFIRFATRRPVVYVGLALLLAVWLWKLGQNPAYW